MIEALPPDMERTHTHTRTNTHTHTHTQTQTQTHTHTHPFLFRSLVLSDLTRAQDSFMFEALYQRAKQQLVTLQAEQANLRDKTMQV